MYINIVQLVRKIRRVGVQACQPTNFFLQDKILHFAGYYSFSQDTTMHNKYIVYLLQMNLKLFNQDTAENNS